ncbi:MAG TPA: DUF4350 domain-containing protein [Novosphingobium sp.]|nr:DUF4350 domain-containing protein [Novosphingobium sp.]
MLGVVLVGTALFVALLWMIGTGRGWGDARDGGAHAGSNGLTGYGALAAYAKARGHAVRLSRSPAALDDPGLVVLTPPHQTDGAELEHIVAARREVGPTMVILPKWLAAPVPMQTPGARRGWVMLAATASPRWEGFRDAMAVGIAPVSAPRWQADGLIGQLPEPKAVQSGLGENLLPLVESADGRALAGWIDDDGPYPLVLVFEPDLLNNWAMAQRESARLADQLFAGMDADGAVTFDLTLNGHARSANLLTLAFTPPYLAATLCLLIAGLVVGWRAFVRFGPALVPARALAFGKGELVANSAALVERAGRLRLVAAPYAEAARARMARALALPPQADEAAIDRALAARHPGAPAFSALSARLRQARRPRDITQAAQALHALERTLTR